MSDVCAINKSVCTILICGYNDDCGQDDIEELIQKSSVFKNPFVIVKESDFFKTYPLINSFDHIILCRRNVRDFTKK